MADVSVNSVKASEASDEMVALYLMASVADSTNGVVVNLRDGIPVIGAPDKDWVLDTYVECLRVIKKRGNGR